MSNKCIKIDRPTNDGQMTIQVPDGMLVSFENGLQVSAGMSMLQSGPPQAYVTVNTENASRDQVDDNGEPILEILCNDTTLYDNEGQGNRPLKTLDERELWQASVRVLRELRLKVEVADIDRDEKLLPSLDNALNVFDVAEDVADSLLDLGTPESGSR